MRYIKYLALLSLLMLPLAYSQAQVAVRIGYGPAYGYVGAAPVCPYGYYDYYPYACAPYGYYGPNWFAGGVFIGAGPWYHGWGHQGWERGRWGDLDRGWDRGRGFDRGEGFRGGFRGRETRAFNGQGGFRSSGFRGNAGFHGGGGGVRGGGFHGGSASHGSGGHGGGHR